MKRISYETIERIYDYTTRAEADKHKSEMVAKGWHVEDEYTLEDWRYNYCIKYSKVGGALA